MALLRAGLVRAIEPVPAVAVDLMEGDLEGVHVHRDSEIGEGASVHVLPGGVGPHQRLADIEKDGAQAGASWNRCLHAFSLVRRLDRRDQAAPAVAVRI